MVNVMIPNLNLTMPELVKIPTVNFKIPRETVPWSKILLWIVVLTAFGIMIAALIFSSSPNDNKTFDNNISTSTMSNLADQLSTNYGLARASDSFLTGINGVKFTNNVVMETDDSCAFRFNIGDCSDDCPMKSTPPDGNHEYTFQVQGTLDSTFMFPIPGNTNYVMQSTDDSQEAKFTST